MKFKLKDILKRNEIEAWQSRLPPEKRYPLQELEKIYNSDVKDFSFDKSYFTKYKTRKIKV
jgi:hypothetical protein